MITQEDVARLKGLGPEQKFFVIEQLARQRLKAARLAADQYEEPEYDEFDYMVDILAAAQEYDIEELASYEVPWRGSQDCEARCQRFRDEASRVSQRLLYRYGTNDTTVALDGATKEKISHWLRQMRHAVQQAEVSAEKKDRLFALIDHLQMEVDRERTPVLAAGELWMTLCTYMGDGAKKALEPATPLIERICRALGIAKQTEDAQPKQLPTAREPKRIEAAKPTPKNNKFSKPLDDEIPF